MATFTVGSVVINVVDIDRAQEFWSAVLGVAPARSIPGFFVWLQPQHPGGRGRSASQPSVVAVGDAELVAFGVAHHPPGEVAHVVRLHQRATELLDPGLSRIEVVYTDVEVDPISTGLRIERLLQGD